MWRKKREKYRLVLTVDEARILRKIMLYFRNKTLEEGKPTEDIEELIIKLSWEGIAQGREGHFTAFLFEKEREKRGCESQKTEHRRF